MCTFLWLTPYVKYSLHEATVKTKDHTTSSISMPQTGSRVLKQLCKLTHRTVTWRKQCFSSYIAKCIHAMCCCILKIVHFYVTIFQLHALATKFKKCCHGKHIANTRLHRDPKKTGPPLGQFYYCSIFGFCSPISTIFHPYNQ